MAASKLVLMTPAGGGIQQKEEHPEGPSALLVSSKLNLSKACARTL